MLSPYGECLERPLSSAGACREGQGPDRAGPTEGEGREAAGTRSAVPLRWALGSPGELSFVWHWGPRPARASPCPGALHSITWLPLGQERHISPGHMQLLPHLGARGAGVMCIPAEHSALSL